MNDKQSVSRRKFLIGAGALATTVLATGSLAGCGQTEEPPKEEAKPEATPTAAAPAKAEALPWKYEKLDVEAIRKAGYEGYFKGGCMYGAAVALLTELRKHNPAYNALPDDLFKYGAGGAYGWGTLCGALNGCLSVMAVAVDNPADISNELMGWYTLFPFPSDKHDAYAKFPKQVTTVANSPLCHNSVSKWCAEANATVNGDEKKDRCGKLTGDVAAYAAELLNAYADKKFSPTFKPGAYASCMSCHTGKDSKLDSVQGKMDCLECHDDHTKQS